MSENNKLVSGGFQFVPFKIVPEIIQARESALEQSALIGKVENRAQNETSVKARKTIKSLLSLFESERKKLKEPILEAGRQLDREVDNAREELKREDARLEELEKGFLRAELARAAEEEALRQKEIARIEAERQAELLRIARAEAAAKAEAERIVREQEQRERAAREAAAKLAAEATNAKQRAAAEAARMEVEQQAEANRIANEAAAKLAAKAAIYAAQQAQERADQAVRLESKPSDIGRASGQSIRKVWIIEQINDFQLLKARPDLVRKIEWDMTGLKEALASGQKLPGVVAREDIGVGSRGGKSFQTIDV